MGVIVSGSQLPIRRSRDGDEASGEGSSSGAAPGSIEPRIDGWRAPVAAVAEPGLPFQVRYPRTANARASLAWTGTPSSSVVRTVTPGSADLSHATAVAFLLPPPDR